MIGMFFMYLLLFLYCDQVVANEYGVAKQPLFFLDWCKKKAKKNQGELDQNLINQDDCSAFHYEPLSSELQPTVIINQLQKKFGKKIVVNNISFRLYPGQIFCLLGHNGAGKTTTISLLTGMIEKTYGSVSMYGLDLDQDLDKIRLSLGLCTQKDCLYDELTVIEHLQFIQRIKRVENQADQIESLLQTTELIYEKDKLVSSLSGGSKRKLSLAMALVGDAKVIFLDEPTSGMDAYSRRAIWAILERIKEQQRTIILTTHHLDEVEILADRVGIMARGQLLAVGSSQYIKKQFGEGYTLSIRGDKLSKSIVPKHIPECQSIAEMCNVDMLSYNIPFSAQTKFLDLFKELETHGFRIDLRLNTLEDAFVKIGKDEALYFAERNREESVQEKVL